MNQESNLPAKTGPQSKAKWSWEKRLLISITSIILLLTLSLAVMRYKQHVADTISPYQPVTAIQSFSYKSLSDQTLKGQSGNDSMKFKGPSDLVKVLETTKPASVEFAKFSGPNKMLPYISYLSAASLPGLDNPVNSDQLESGLASGPGASHQAAINALKTYINNHKTGFYEDPVISEPQNFTVLGGKAWLADFTLSAGVVTSKIDRPANIPQAQSVMHAPTVKSPDYQGKIVVGFGKSTIYYFMVYDLSSDWQANQNIWQQVVNSLKIDQ